MISMAMHMDIRTYRSRLRELDGHFDGEDSPSPASRAPSRDDYTTIFYHLACMAVGGGFRPPALPTTELEYVGAARVDELE
ncbi:hypothetical protein Scep_027380 [Stephania cephalantha]|uniref:Uncharacterized protein n=1 Tax=Stephania cephalantha TaxID=152367 RepID=A0AAP0EFE1_9MAGN